MSDPRPAPARPWYDLVKEQAAIQGWSMHELARRSTVGRPTIYRWRDGTEVPQARPVGLVADVLGIPRERAVRLAGIITDRDDADRSTPPAVPLRDGTKAAIREDFAGDPVLGEQAVAYIEGLASGRIPPAAPSSRGGRPQGDGQERHRGHG